MSRQEVVLRFVVSKDHAHAKDKLAKMVIERLRQETIEEGRAQTKDVNEVLHCLVSTRDFLGRIPWHSGF